MPLVIDPKKYILGAARIYYRATGGSGPWTSVGSTLDDAVARVVTTWWRPDNIAGGILGPIKGLDILRRVEAEVEFTVPELSAANLGVIVPGSQSATAVLTDTASGVSTTLAAAAAVGDTNIKATAVTGITVGMFMRIETGTNREIRQIDTVGTLGAGGSGLSFRDPLQKAHASLSNLVQTDGDGRTTITAPTVRRQPDTAYNDWAAVGESGNGYNELRLLNAISQTDRAELAMGDQTLAGIRVTIASRYDGANLTSSPFQLITP